jgi:Smg protein
MFDVLAFVYQSYFQCETCPEAAQLERKLGAVGFDNEEIADALA